MKATAWISKCDFAVLPLFAISVREKFVIVRIGWFCFCSCFEWHRRWPRA